ncbi:MAG TPA: M23 family metallopeptidase [Longimicrobiales bacterium]
MYGFGGGRRRMIAACAVLAVAGAAAAAETQTDVETAGGEAGAHAAPSAAPAHAREFAPHAIASLDHAFEPALADVAWLPERPAQGTIFTVSVRPDGAAIQRVSGEFAGEPLHFEPGDDAFTALAAVPVDAEGELTLRLEVRTVDGRVERREAPVPVAPGEYRMEQLTVAPRYGGGYDEATTARIRRESARAREVSRRSHGTPRLWEPPFVRPRPGRVTSGFGNGREFNGRVQSRHTGTDFAGGVGAPVRAAARGVVRLVDSFYIGGNVIYIDHGAGLVTAYLHLSEQTVAEGDTVQAGQEIGRVGATGRVTGPHLHWIVRYGQISVDGLSLPGIER